MNKDDIEYLAKIVYDRSGIVLTQEKAYLLESRLAPIARKEGFNSVDDLVGTLRGRADEKMAWPITDAMTTNETFFFRDKTPFDNLKNHVLPELKARKSAGKVRIWCAASSTGQEPYSIAMLLNEEASKYPGLSFEITGTDISNRVVEKAKSGLYSQFEVQRGLPVTSLVKYFDKVDDMWQLKPNIRSQVTFKQGNLQDDFTSLGKFDIIFCRNVLIYFDQPTKAKILERMATMMPDNGYLFLGAAETVMGLTDAFNSSREVRGVYTRQAGWTRAKAA